VPSKGWEARHQDHFESPGSGTESRPCSIMAPGNLLRSQLEIKQYLHTWNLADYHYTVRVLCRRSIVIRLSILSRGAYEALRLASRDITELASHLGKKETLFSPLIRPASWLELRNVLVMAPRTTATPSSPFSKFDDVESESLSLSHG